MKKILILVLVMAISGCASVIGGRNQHILLVPDNDEEVTAMVTTRDWSQELTLPATIYTRKTKKDIVVRIDENACHEKSYQTIASSLNPLILGNVIIGGVIGLIVDFSTGAAWKFSKTETVHVKNKETCKVK